MAPKHWSHLLVHRSARESIGRFPESGANPLFEELKLLKVKASVENVLKNEMWQLTLPSEWWCCHILYQLPIDRDQTYATRIATTSPSLCTPPPLGW